MDNTTKYGFSVGDIVETKIPIKLSDDKKIVQSGTKIKIISITPKAYIPNKNVIDNITVDNKSYFFNAVLLEDIEHKNRIRQDFCTVRKIKK